MRAVRLGVVLSVLAGGLVFAAGAHAAYPGRNGGIGYYYTSEDGNATPATSSEGLSSIETSPPFHLDCTYSYPQYPSPPPPKPPFTICPGQSPSFVNGFEWSPNGRTVAFDAPDHQGNGVLGLVNSDNSGARLLPELTAEDTEPTWAPAADTLAFAGRDRAAARHQKYIFRVRQNIYRVGIDGHGLRRLTGHGGSSPVWSVRQRIAFVRSGDIFVMFTDGSHQRRITHDGHIGRVDWSPDGRRILYDHFVASRRRGYPGTSELHVIGGDGRHGHLLFRPGYDAAFSPDGRQVAYMDSTYGCGDGDLYTARVDGSNRRDQVGCNSGVDAYGLGSPGWKPLTTESPSQAGGTGR